MPITTHMKTICVGRLLIDVPAESTITMGEFIVDDVSIDVEPNVTQGQFVQRMRDRWQEANAWVPDSIDHRYLHKPAERIEPTENGVIFMWGERNISFDDKRPQYVHDTEGYLWRDGTLYTFEKDLNSEKNFIAIMKRIRSRPDDVLPTTPGLCNVATFIPDDGVWHSDQIRLNIDVPSLNTSIGIIVQSIDGAPPERLLDRMDQRAPIATRELAEWAKNHPGEEYGEMKFRWAHRLVGRWPGDEVIGGGTDNKGRDGFSTGVTASWEFPGETRSTTMPHIALDMDTNYRTTQPPHPWGSFPKGVASGQLTETEFFALWDKMVDSLRLRPGAV